MQIVAKVPSAFIVGVHWSPPLHPPPRLSHPHPLACDKRDKLATLALRDGTTIAVPMDSSARCSDRSHQRRQEPVRPLTWMELEKNLQVACLPLSRSVIQSLVRLAPMYPNPSGYAARPVNPQRPLARQRPHVRHSTILRANAQQAHLPVYPMQNKVNLAPTTQPAIRASPAFGTAQQPRRGFAKQRAPQITTAKPANNAHPHRAHNPKKSASSEPNKPHHVDPVSYAKLAAHASPVSYKNQHVASPSAIKPTPQPALQMNAANHLSHSITKQTTHVCAKPDSTNHAAMVPPATTQTTFA